MPYSVDSLEVFGPTGTVTLELTQDELDWCREMINHQGVEWLHELASIHAHTSGPGLEMDLVIEYLQKIDLTKKLISGILLATNDIREQEREREKVLGGRSGLMTDPEMREVLEDS